MVYMGYVIIIMNHDILHEWYISINISPFLFFGYFLNPHFWVPTGSTFRPEHRHEIGVHQVYELYELYELYYPPVMTYD